MTDARENLHAVRKEHAEAQRELARRVCFVNDLGRARNELERQHGEAAQAFGKAQVAYSAAVAEDEKLSHRVSCLEAIKEHVVSRRNTLRDEFAAVSGSGFESMIESKALEVAPHFVMAECALRGTDAEILRELKRSLQQVRATTDAVTHEYQEKRAILADLQQQLEQVNQRLTAACQKRREGEKDVEAKRETLFEAAVKFAEWAKATGYQPKK